MIESDITKADGHWDQKIQLLQELLKQIKPQLIAAEAELSERLAAISVFEYKVRFNLERLTRRLDDLELEIAQLKRKLRKLQEDWFFGEDNSDNNAYAEWRFTDDAGAAAEGSYRYHEGKVKPLRQELSVDQSTKLKQFYRRLARRFHPDFALDEEDRAYRTSIMMAINAAYTAGDLERLKELMNQPEPHKRDYTDRDLAEALLKELHHCENRIKEIAEELKQLDDHPSSKLMKREKVAASEGRNLLEEIAAELRERISQRMVQRDVLEAEIEAFNNGQPDFAHDDFADVVYDLGLEEILTDESDSGISEWREKYHSRSIIDDEPDESAWDGLRKARKGGKKKG